MTQQGRLPYFAQLFLTFTSHHSVISVVMMLLILSMVNEQMTTAIPAKLLTTNITVTSKQRYLHDFSNWLYSSTFSRELMPIGEHISKTELISGVRLSTRVIHTAVGRELVYILDVDLSNPNVRLGVVQAHGRLISPDETLTSMAKRTRAVAGINGDYYEFQGSGVPIGEEVINGQLLHSPNPHYLAVLGVTRAGRLTIGPEVYSASVVDGRASHTLYSINHYSEFNNGRLLLFNSALGEPVYVGGDPVAMIQPIAGSPGSYIVRSVLSSVSSLPVLSHQQALLGSGEAGWWLTHTLSIGDRIKITTSISPDPNLKLAIGGGPVVVKNGSIFYDQHPTTSSPYYNRYALTSVGVSRDGTHAFLVVFNGSSSDAVGSRGMTYFEAAHFMLALGSFNAMMLDGGRSSEMVAHLPGHKGALVINRPSSGGETPLANGLFIYQMGERSWPDNRRFLAHVQ